MADKIGIMGAGALGSYVGAFLSRTGEDVTFLDMWPEHVEKMRTDGLHVTGSQGPFTVRGSLRSDVPARVILPSVVSMVALTMLEYSGAEVLCCSVMFKPRSRANTGALIRLTWPVVMGAISPARTAACKERVSCSAISPS